MYPLPKKGGRPIKFHRCIFSSEDAGRLIRRKMSEEAVKVRASFKEDNLSIEKKIGGLISFFTLRGVKFLISDWDRTALDIHTRGMCVTEHIPKLATRLCPHWLLFVEFGMKNKMQLAIATFSDEKTIQKSLASFPNATSEASIRAQKEYFNSMTTGGAMVVKTLKEYNKLIRDDCSMYQRIIPKYCVGKYPLNYQTPEDYHQVGLKGPMFHSKRYHIQYVLKAENIESDVVVLIDDDFANIISAVNDGHYAIWCLGENGFLVDCIDIFEPYSIIDVVETANAVNVDKLTTDFK